MWQNYYILYWTPLIQLHPIFANNYLLPTYKIYISFINSSSFSTWYDVISKAPPNVNIFNTNKYLSYMFMSWWRPCLSQRLSRLCPFMHLRSCCGHSPLSYPDSSCCNTTADHLPFAFVCVEVVECDHVLKARDGIYTWQSQYCHKSSTQCKARAQ